MPLPARELANSDEATCTLCGATNRARVFPALFSANTGPVETQTALEGEAACFDHPGKRAVASCQQCGRFVCQLCSVEFGDGVWCPSCVASGAGKAKPAKLDTSRPLYDSTALILPLASLLLYPLTLIAAPASIVLAIVKWRQPISLVRRNRWRFVAAILISLTEIGLWTLLIVYLATGGFRRSR